MGFGNAFGDFGDAPAEEINEAGWDAFGEESAFDSKKFPLTFARSELVEVLNVATPGNKKKESGL